MNRMALPIASHCTITDMETGRIIRIISNQYEVLCESGAYSCVAMGKLRKGTTPLVGDLVAVEHFVKQSGIQKIYPRHNELRRPAIANVDQAIIVMSAKEPQFSSALIDRFLFQIVYHEIEPILCITKMDLISEQDEIHAQIQMYQESGYRVYTSGKGEAPKGFADVLKDKISVLCGQSGVGKSSLFNKLDPSFHLQTQQISKALGRGKHTTRHCELHAIQGGWLADTPGFSSMDFTYMEPLTLAQRIPDFKKYINQCKFRDCMHISEPNCALREALVNNLINAQRYAHYCEIVSMIQAQKRKY